jgi:hypothetical protein
MTRYKMIANDPNSYPNQKRFWITSAPDFNALQFDGYKAGLNAFNEVKAYEVLDGYAVINYFLPNPDKWFQVSRKSLPSPANGASLAIVDGYSWLFGGSNSNQILRSSLNTPATWTQVGTLPSALSHSHLAIIGSTIYLFGGSDGYGQPTNHVYSAPTSSPTTWTDLGSHLNVAVSNGSLMMLGGSNRIYIYGGLTTGGATTGIQTALTSSPLSWSASSNFLPAPLYSSSVGMADGYIFLFAGENAVNNPVSTIYRAPIATPSIFTAVGNLPFPISSGKFFTVGAQGYLIGYSANPLVPNRTSILQCDLTDPLTWTDMMNILPGDPSRSVPGILSNFSFMITDDRLWILGGNNSTNILTTEQQLTFSYTDPKPSAYGAATRTTFQMTDNLNNPFLALGFPYWLTSY